MRQINILEKYILKYAYDYCCPSSTSVLALTPLLYNGHKISSFFFLDVGYGCCYYLQDLLFLFIPPIHISCCLHSTLCFIQMQKISRYEWIRIVFKCAHALLSSMDCAKNFSFQKKIFFKASVRDIKNMLNIIGEIFDLLGCGFLGWAWYRFYLQKVVGFPNKEYDINFHFRVVAQFLILMLDEKNSISRKRSCDEGSCALYNFFITVGSIQFEVFLWLLQLAQQSLESKNEFLLFSSYAL